MLTLSGSSVDELIRREYAREGRGQAGEASEEFVDGVKNVISKMFDTFIHQDGVPSEEENKLNRALNRLVFPEKPDATREDTDVEHDGPQPIAEEEATSADSTRKDGEKSDFTED